MRKFNRRLCKFLWSFFVFKPLSFKKKTKCKFSHWQNFTKTRFCWHSHCQTLPCNAM